MLLHGTTEAITINFCPFLVKLFSSISTFIIIAIIVIVVVVVTHYMVEKDSLVCFKFRMLDDRGIRYRWVSNLSRQKHNIHRSRNKHRMSCGSMTCLMTIIIVSIALVVEVVAGVVFCNKLISSIVTICMNKRLLIASQCRCGVMILTHLSSSWFT